MAHYRHTQTALFFTIPIIGFTALSILARAIGSPDAAGVAMTALIIVPIVAFIVVVFSKLTIEVDGAGVSASFGLFGWPRRRLPWAEIDGVEIVRNRWWMGWGYRFIPNGRLFNIWGLDAVELTLVNGKVMRLGSDEVHDLHSAIRRHLDKR